MLNNLAFSAHSNNQQDGQDMTNNRISFETLLLCPLRRTGKPPGVLCAYLLGGDFTLWGLSPRQQAMGERRDVSST